MSAAPPPDGAFPADAWGLLRDGRALARALAAVGGSDAETAHRRLWAEFWRRGSSVRRAARALGVTPYRFDAAMARLYASDAFLYELAVWNRNLLKRGMRSWIRRWIARGLGPGQRVLCWGDGLGFDALALAQAGHRVCAFDLPGPTRDFARRLHAAAGASVTAIADPADLAPDAFDVVVCLDVLEHAPDAPAELARLVKCLRPGGVLFVHAPFYFLHRVAITHLRVNRRHSGSLAFYRRAGLALFDGQPSWAPLVFVRRGGPPPRRPWLAWPRLLLAVPFGAFYSLGRFTALPFELVNLVCRLAQPWPGRDAGAGGAGAAAPAGPAAP